MTITFTKKDGTERTINGRLNVTKHLAGGKRTLDDSFIIIYSMADKGYRAVNKDTINSDNQVWIQPRAHLVELPDFSNR